MRRAPAAPGRSRVRAGRGRAEARRGAFSWRHSLASSRGGATGKAAPSTAQLRLSMARLARRAAAPLHDGEGAADHAAEMREMRDPRLTAADAEIELEERVQRREHPRRHRD